MQTLNEAKELLRKLHACPDAIEFLREAGNPQEAWRTCERGDWMVWLIAELIGLKNTINIIKVDIIELKKLVRVLCRGVRISLPFLPAEETAALTTIEIVEAWTRGEASLEQVKDAANAAACATAAHAAARVATHAACATADTVTLFVAADTDAARAAAHAACAAADEAMRSKILKQAADIVRESYPDWPV